MKRLLLTLLLPLSLGLTPLAKAETALYCVEKAKGGVWFVDGQGYRGVRFEQGKRTILFGAEGGFYKAKINGFVLQCTVKSGLKVAEGAPTPAQHAYWRCTNEDNFQLNLSADFSRFMLFHSSAWTHVLERNEGERPASAIVSVGNCETF